MVLHGQSFRTQNKAIDIGEWSICGGGQLERFDVFKPSYASVLLVSFYVDSSISSSLNSLAACCWKDLMEWHWGHMPEHLKALISKGLGRSLEVFT